MLKTMVRQLEEELMKEKTKHQRHVSKHGQQYRDLLEEVSTSAMSADTDSSTGTCSRR